MDETNSLYRVAFNIVFLTCANISMIKNSNFKHEFAELKTADWLPIRSHDIQIFFNAEINFRVSQIKHICLKIYTYGIESQYMRV